MFTIFLIGLAAASSIVLGALLMRSKEDAQELRLPYGLVSVVAVVVGLVALGLWMV